jgi:predicted nucleic acid-binding protein
MRSLLLHALDLSVQYQLSLWGCVYLALALERDCALLTADARLFRGGRGRHPSIRLVE